MNGTFVAVVGSSGAGKDSVMAYARDRLQRDVTIVRRVVTRPADGGSEDHDSMTMDQFVAAETEGRFALSWEAHGLRYGLPIGLEEDLHAGRVVIANLSRAVLPRLMLRYPNAVVVEVTADPQVIAERLAGRGREDAEDIQRRMDRSVGVRMPASTVRIDNSGALEQAGEQFVSLIRDLLRVGV
ncbi:ribose 1,5-bisphosphokinase [Devosia crocina]|uniref:Ribose 1,5-bisphosphate phosphokinase PhnN n=1 Tax=Devosia crocina TaxID=429728 RepID=A0A1I7NRM0_9HYPH|nr:phosphonate metabolism protein/1,5-bisphosphokinase (PRPP-forming) PhnN [Devosia crocina]SFV37252.1 ribose 1,5-bisphosphokinase [Devosia crocina]